MRVIDPNKLLTVLVNGYDTYSDGRHSFQYENLIKVLKESGIEVDDRALYEENKRRYSIKNKRRKPYQKSNNLWKFTLTDNPDTHFDLIFSGENEFPTWAKQEETEWEENQAKYTYWISGKAGAVELYKWIKKYHPTRKDFKIIKTNV
jgi:hypothetical protein